MRYTNCDILVYTAMADAYAMATEYIKLPEHRRTRDACLRFERYVQHPTFRDVVAGCYTDDTEMSAANAQVLVDYDPPYTALMFADAWVREFKRGRGRKGYSRRFQALLESVHTGKELLVGIVPHSDKNGACMRAAVFGVLPTVHDVLTVADFQARITHDTPAARFSARLVALMSHFMFYEPEPPARLPEYCADNLTPADVATYAGILTTRWSGEPVTDKPGMPVSLTTAHAVLDLVTHQPTLMDMLRQTIRWGGDTDSVAALAWGIASTHRRTEVLPAFLERDLEQGSAQTGIRYLYDLGGKLMKKFA